MVVRPGWLSLVAAIGLAFLVSLALDVLLNAVLLREAFEAGQDHFRPAEELNRLVPWAWLAMLLSIALHAGLFARMGLQGLATGLEFGLWLGLAALISGLALATLVPWPRQLILSMAIQQLLTQVVTGLSLGWLYRPPP